MLRTLSSKLITRCGFYASACQGIQKGESLPSIEVARKSPADAVNVFKLFSETKKGVLFGVPGAFTPGCTKTHLPGYIKLAKEFKSKGVGLVACVSINDAFVMNAWGESLGNNDAVTLLADSKGELAKAMDLNFDASGALGGHRFKRFAAIIEQGKIQQLFVEPDTTGLNVSLAENVLKSL
ncbi:thioredoxin-like protein [Spinellus fusiger]|nr:thioredoxin-like protein [Spinellus fusiger]